MHEIERFANPGVCKILVGNKCDMEEIRKVSTEEGAELARHFEIPFLETSAKNSINVEQSFITMSKEIKKNIANKPAAGGTGVQGTQKPGIKFGQGNSLQDGLSTEGSTTTLGNHLQANVGGKPKSSNACCQ